MSGEHCCLRGFLADNDCSLHKDPKKERGIKRLTKQTLAMHWIFIARVNVTLDSLVILRCR